MPILNPIPNPASISNNPIFPLPSSSPSSSSTTPTAPTPTPSLSISKLSISSPLSPPSQPTIQSPPLISHPTIPPSPSLSPPRPLRRMSSTGTQLRTSPNSFLAVLDRSGAPSARRFNSSDSCSDIGPGPLDDILIGGECGVPDGGKAAGSQPLASQNWIAHHLSAVLQHSFTVSSPHPITSATSPTSPTYPNSRSNIQFNALSNNLMTEPLRNKVSLTSLSSFTASSATDEDEEDDMDEAEEADSQASASSSYSFAPPLESDPSQPTRRLLANPLSHMPSHPTSPQIIVPLSQFSTERSVLLGLLNTWSFDANSLSALQIRSSLHILLSVYLTYTPGFILRLENMGVNDPQECLRGLVDNLEVAYDARNAYHNFRHAVDVVQAVYTILAFEGVVPPLGWVLQKEAGTTDSVWYRRPVGRVGRLLDEMTVWALLLAAAGHDVGHPGLSNAFMVNARTPIAYVFSDGAVLENFHRITFTRMLREHGFEKVVDGHAGFREVLAGAVLATDMGRHFPIVEELKRLACRWNSTPEGEFQTEEQALADKVLVTAGLIKCGDISNSSRPHPISLTWSSCLLNEWSRQAALETDLRLPVSVVTLDPAEKRAQAKSQIGFTTLFVLPLFTVIEQLSPTAFRPFCDNCRVGLKTWQKVIEQIDAKIRQVVAPPTLHPVVDSPEEIPTPARKVEGSFKRTVVVSPTNQLFSPLSTVPTVTFDEHSLPIKSAGDPRSMRGHPTPITSPNGHAGPGSKEVDEANSTPKPAASGGWWMSSPSPISANPLSPEFSTPSSISSSSVWTIRGSRNGDVSGDRHHEAELSVEPRTSERSLDGDGEHESTIVLSPNGGLLNPASCALMIKLSVSPNGSHAAQRGGCQSSDDGKANSANDDSSFSSLGSPSSPPRSPYFTPGVSSASSLESSNDHIEPRMVIVNGMSQGSGVSEGAGKRTREGEVEHLGVCGRPRDKGMSVDFGLGRRTIGRTSLPTRKKSYSPYLVNQQVACARGCGKVTVKCVKCAAESKLKMYRSMSLAKPPLQLRPEYLTGPRVRLAEDRGEWEGHRAESKQNAGDCVVRPSRRMHHALAGLPEESGPEVPAGEQDQAPLTHDQSSWPPYPFRPL